jgi:hypothetical protein
MYNPSTNDIFCDEHGNAIKPNYTGLQLIMYTKGTKWRTVTQYKMDMEVGKAAIFLT